MNVIVNRIGRIVLIVAGCFVAAQFLRLLLVVPFTLFIGPALEERGVRFTFDSLWLIGRVFDLIATIGAILMWYTWRKLTRRPLITH